MLKYFKLIKVVISVLSVLLCSCAVTEKKVDFFYSVPTVSYLREGPAYDRPVVTEIYNADKVKLLEKNDAGWWQVQSIRDQKIGWTQRDLLSENPLISKSYYVKMDGLPLRDSPNEDIVSRRLLEYGDQVKKIADKGDWWRVLVEKEKAIGWIPAAMATETPPQPMQQSEKMAAGCVSCHGDGCARAPGQMPEDHLARVNPKQSSVKPEGAPETLCPAKPAYYFVAAENLKLYLIPSIPSQVVKVLKLNDKVEKISQSGSIWIKIRYLNTGVEGWAFARYLRDTPVTEKNQIVTDKKKSLKKASSPSPQTQGPTSESIEPEGM
jgi:uncharacterized protein YgiM (DUF1202 family)